MFTALSDITELSNAVSETGGTSLITLYIPSNSNIANYTNQLTNELSTSQNIKDKNVRSSVQKALKSGIIKLNQISEFPENGLVLCCGEIKYDL